MTDTANLEDGFYWVRAGEKWEAAYWNNNHLYIVGSGECYDCSHFQEIDPRPIKREESE